MLLGLPARFDLDPQVIERAFFDRTKELHPDRFATAPAPERVAALSRMRAVNDAYQTLKNPIARAEYLLARDGVTIGDNEQLPHEVLLPILEQREELAETIAAKRRAHVAELRAMMKRRRDQAAETGLATGFATAQPAMVKSLLIVLRYMDRYLEQCDAALDAAEDEE